MDWMPLTSDKVTFIADAIGYAGQAEKASTLYQNLTSVKCALEDKVKFLLLHWGWYSQRKGHSFYRRNKRDGLLSHQMSKQFLNSCTDYEYLQKHKVLMTSWEKQ